MLVVLNNFTNDSRVLKTVKSLKSMGFNAPDNIWLKAIDMKSEIKNSKILKEICDFDKLDSKFDKLNQNLKLRLYNVAIWERVYDVK